MDEQTDPAQGPDEPEDQYDYSVRPGQKGRSRAARSYRRRWKWENRNAPRFGPENGWEVDPDVPTRTPEQRRNYLWTGTF